MSEPVPKQADQKARVPNRREGSGIFKEEERTKVFFFPSTFLSLSHRKHFFSLSPALIITQQTQFKLCSKGYRTMHLLEDGFSFLKTF